MLDNVKGVTNCYEYTFGVNVVIQTLSRLKRVSFCISQGFQQCMNQQRAYVLRFQVLKTGFVPNIFVLGHILGYFSIVLL